MLTAAHCFLDANGAKDNTTPMVIIGAYKNAWNDQNWAGVQVRTTYGTFCHNLCECVWGGGGGALRGGFAAWAAFCFGAPEGFALTPLTPPRPPHTPVCIRRQPKHR